MMPFNPSFRRLVLRNIPQLTAEDLDQHENLIAVRHHEIQEVNIVPDPDEPDIDVVPPSHNYCSVTTGSSKTKTFMIKNVGTTILEVSKTTLTGENKDQFQIDSGAAPFSVEPAADPHELVVSFKPASEGFKNAVLEIKSNDPAPGEANLKVPLTGIGVQEQVPDIAGEPELLDYGQVVVGGKESQTLLVKNEGNAVLSVEETKVIGDAGQDFTIIGDCAPFDVAPGDCKELVVQFMPTVGETREAVLRIVSNDPDENPFEVPLKGVGVFDVPVQGLVKSSFTNGKLNFRECLVNDATHEANAIFAPYKKVYDATVKLYNARRRVALAGGNLLQIPANFKGFITLIGAIISYRLTQIETFPTIAVNRIIYFFREPFHSRASDWNRNCHSPDWAGLFHYHSETAAASRGPGATAASPAWSRNNRNRAAC